MIINLILDETMRTTMREAVRAREDGKLLTILRERHGEEISDVSYAELLSRIADGRALARELEIYPESRIQFILMGAVRFPRFWEDASLMAFMRSPTGNAQARFEDMCGVLKLSATRAGQADKVWW